MAKEDDMVLFRIEDNVGIITLNRPDKLNAVSWELAEELAALLNGTTVEELPSCCGIIRRAVFGDSRTCRGLWTDRAGGGTATTGCSCATGGSTTCRCTEGWGRAVDSGGVSGWRRVCRAARRWRTRRRRGHPG